MSTTRPHQVCDTVHVSQIGPLRVIVKGLGEPMVYVRFELQRQDRLRDPMRGDPCWAWLRFSTFDEHEVMERMCFAEILYGFLASRSWTGLLKFTFFLASFGYLVVKVEVL